MNSDLVVAFEYKKPSIFLRITLWLLGLLFLAIISLFIYINVITNKFVKSFCAAASISQEDFVNTSSKLLNQFQKDYEQVAQLPKKYNFLILGTDKLSGRDGDPELTDTILLLQTDLENGKIKTLSFPRDLYLEDWQTKINAIYFYGKEKYANNPEQFPQEVVEQLTNLKINHTIVIAIEDLQQLIEIVGGIEIDVPVAFTDPLFPVPGVNVKEVTDPKILYEEISFQAGPQYMDSNMALKYMRSRHSGDDEGTDEARAKRQQLVLEALFNKMLSTRDAQTLGKLYRFYLDRFSKYISLEEITSIAAVSLDHFIKDKNEFSFEKHQISIFPEDESGLIYNPPLWQTKQQWVYKIRDGKKFSESIYALFK